MLWQPAPIPRCSQNRGYCLLSYQTRFKHLFFLLYLPCRTRTKLSYTPDNFLPHRTHTKLSPHTPNCHAELVSASLLLVNANLHNTISLLTPKCHAELVSASRIFYKQRQADKWNNEILKQVQDDIFFLSSFLGLTREPGLSPLPSLRAKQSSLTILP